MPRLDRDNPNTSIGIILLVILAVFILPERLPEFLRNFSPGLLGGVACEGLPAASDLAAHQSILGRSAVDPLRLEVAASGIGEDGGLSIRLSLTNQSLGSVPILYQGENVVVAGEEDSSNGLGVIIDPPPAEGGVERAKPDATGYAESDIRFLGPRQTCLHELEVRASTAMISDGGTLRAWYRMTIAGEHQPQSEGTRLIYPDQGLAILSEDVVFSEEIAIEARP
ncbi:MAG: hypothetical protein OXG78_05900 [Chloroflexi bacterium]|nr:hypothetical protein [Chloroflexota bacterium]